MDKNIDIDNIIIDKLGEIKKPKLIECKMQLTDTKKIKFGFDLDESIIDVEQDGFATSYEDDILYTYGIEPCCGLVLCDENVRILFHLDGTIKPEDVISITDKINLSQNAIVIVAPGASCGMPGSFNYKQIEEEYKRRGYMVTEQRIPATFGFVKLDSDRVTIGTGVDRSLDVILTIPKRKKQVQSDKSIDNSIQELINLKDELLKQNNYNSNSGKRR